MMVLLVRRKGGGEEQYETEDGEPDAATKNLARDGEVDVYRLAMERQEIGARPRFVKWDAAAGQWAPIEAMRPPA